MNDKSSIQRPIFILFAAALTIFFILFATVFVTTAGWLAWRQCRPKFERMRQMCQRLAVAVQVATARLIGAAASRVQSAAAANESTAQPVGNKSSRSQRGRGRVGCGEHKKSNCTVAPADVVLADILTLANASCDDSLSSIEVSSSCVSSSCATSIDDDESNGMTTRRFLLRASTRPRAAHDKLAGLKPRRYEELAAADPEGEEHEENASQHTREPACRGNSATSIAGADASGAVAASASASGWGREVHIHDEVDSEYL